MDNKNFDREAYKNASDNIKLTHNQKEILLEKMREADRQETNNSGKYSNKTKSPYTVWIKAAAASLALALIGGGIYLAASKNPAGETNKNSFIISANAAEVGNGSVIGMFSGESSNQYVLKDFDEADAIYRNKLGKTDYFNSYKLSSLTIQGSNIKSVSFKSNKKSTYFVYHVIESAGEENNKVYDKAYQNSVSASALGEFSACGTLDNSQYSKEEFEQHADGLNGEFCDGFTYTVQNPTSNDSVYDLGELIEFVIETDRTDSEIDEWMNEFEEADNEKYALRAELHKEQGESGTITDEENEIDRKLAELNGKMLKKSVDGTTIDVTVEFADGTTQSDTINVGITQKAEDEDLSVPWLTFSYAE